MTAVTRQHSDALVFFGATGDLAYKKIFPALQSLARAGRLDFPVVGVGRSGITREQLIERAKASVTEYGGLDAEAFPRLAKMLHYVDGDYNAPATFAKVKEAIAHAKRPAHYLAIPPSMFPVVVGHLVDAGLTKDARVIIEKPFGRDLASARELNKVLNQELAPHHLIFQHRAGVTPYTSTFVFAECCVFNKQSQRPGHCDPLQLQPRGSSPNEGVPSPEVTVPFCLVPSPEFSQAPWYSLPAHLCRFGVRFYIS